MAGYCFSRSSAALGSPRHCPCRLGAEPIRRSTEHQEGPVSALVPLDSTTAAPRSFVHSASVCAEITMSRTLRRLLEQVTSPPLPLETRRRSPRGEPASPGLPEVIARVGLDPDLGNACGARTSAPFHVEPRAAVRGAGPHPPSCGPGVLLGRSHLPPGQEDVSPA